MKRAKTADTMVARTAKGVIYCALVAVSLSGWGMAHAQVPTTLLSKLKRLEQSKKIYHQNTRRHSVLQQKFERMARKHKAEMGRYKTMHTKAGVEIKKVYLSLSKYHKGVALRYDKLAKSAQARAQRDKRNARNHLSTARRYQLASKKHAKLAYEYMRKGGSIKFDAKVDSLRRQPMIRATPKRPSLQGIPKIRPHVLVPAKRR